MADLTKCDAGQLQACPFKYSCKRFTAPAAPVVQAYLTTAPYNPVTHSCKEFLSNSPTELRKHGGEKRP